MSSVADHSDYSDEDEDFSSFYSGAAKRYKKEKQAFFPTGEVRLVNKKDDIISTSARNVSPTPVQQIDDSSDEELFRDPNKETPEIDLDETEAHTHTHIQVETLEDVEEYINISPEVSLLEERKVYSSASIQPVDDDEYEEDPLFCAPINDSVRIQVFIFFICLFIKCFCLGIESIPW
jgi:hypothetical protein